MSVMTVARMAAIRRFMWMLPWGAISHEKLGLTGPQRPLDA
jgi:hypothetical protein